MKLYTRRGDDGRTDLFSGQRIDKDALRIEACGTVDELNSVLGLAASGCTFAAIAPVLSQVQRWLFELGADLATPPGSPADERAVRIGQTHVDELEEMIDAACAPLPALKVFVLPGGTELAARLHLARTVCRRAERVIVTLARLEPVGDRTVAFVNRLSDLLFALARRANQLANTNDVPWQPGKTQ